MHAEHQSLGCHNFWGLSIPPSTIVPLLLENVKSHPPTEQILEASDNEAVVWVYLVRYTRGPSSVPGQGQKQAQKESARTYT